MLIWCPLRSLPNAGAQYTYGAWIAKLIFICGKMPSWGADTVYLCIFTMHSDWKKSYEGLVYHICRQKYEKYFFNATSASEKDKKRQKKGLGPLFHYWKQPLWQFHAEYDSEYDRQSHHCRRETGWESEGKLAGKKIIHAPEQARSRHKCKNPAYHEDISRYHCKRWCIPRSQ